MTQKELDEYNGLYDELIQARDEVAEMRECLLGAYECMSSVNNFTLLLLNHPDSKEHHLWRKGLFQYLARLQKNLARGIEQTESEVEG